MKKRKSTRKDIDKKKIDILTGFCFLAAVNRMALESKVGKKI